jgi:hypothetical protein
MADLQRQCAWCRRRIDRAGRLGETPSILLSEASHGLCPSCLSAMMKKESERCATSGNHVRALRIERQRLRLLSNLARLRREGIAARVSALYDRSLTIIAWSREILDRAMLTRRFSPGDKRKPARARGCRLDTPVAETYNQAVASRQADGGGQFKATTE